MREIQEWEKIRALESQGLCLSRSNALSLLEGKGREG